MLNYQRDINDNPYPVCIDVCMVKNKLMYTTQSLTELLKASSGLILRAYRPPTTKKKGVLALYGIYSLIGWFTLVHQSQWGMSEKGWTICQIFQSISQLWDDIHQ
jgi:hypothetical protein